MLPIEKLGPPIVPFYRLFFGGRVPLLQWTTEKEERNKTGTLILTSLLENLESVFLLCSSRFGPLPV